VITRSAGVRASVACLLTIVTACASTADHPPDANTLQVIARDIEGLRASYPQLADFSAQRNANPASLAISYAFHTHEPEPTGGWTSGVPNPDKDGLWFHINFHPANSRAEIDTQPMTITPQCLGHMRVGFLILEGAKARSVNGALWRILRAHGVEECAG
jgi:hypothetical protein